MAEPGETERNLFIAILDWLARPFSSAWHWWRGTDPMIRPVALKLDARSWTESTGQVIAWAAVQIRVPNSNPRPLMITDVAVSRRRALRWRNRLTPDEPWHIETVEPLSEVEVEVAFAGWWSSGPSPLRIEIHRGDAHALRISLPVRHLAVAGAARRQADVLASIQSHAIDQETTHHFELARRADDARYARLYVCRTNGDVETLAGDVTFDRAAAPLIETLRFADPIPCAVIGTGGAVAGVASIGRPKSAAALQRVLDRVT